MTTDQSTDDAGKPCSAGTITNEQFEVYLGAKTINGESLIEALRDHLVGGLTPAEAWAKHALTRPVRMDESPLVSGCVKPEQFELLIQGTSIRGEAVIAALRDHLVGGLSFTDSWTKHDVNKSQLSLRLKAVQAESSRAAKLAPFYIVD